VKSGHHLPTGDFVWLTFDPQTGREQPGRRPALVCNPGVYTAESVLALAPLIGLSGDWLGGIQGR
jgi:mRNA interferase MazF